MTLWNIDPLYPTGGDVGDKLYSPVQNCRKFSHVLGQSL